MGEEGKQLLWLLPKGWDLQDKVSAFGVGSVDWGGCRATQEHRLCLPAAAASCLAGTRGWGFIYLHLDCHGVCLPNIFLVARQAATGNIITLPPALAVSWIKAPWAWDTLLEGLELGEPQGKAFPGSWDGPRQC